MKQNGIHHVKSAPFHLSSNGLAERAVQTFKERMKKIKGDTLQTTQSRFLFSYRIIPHTTTGLSPAELMMSRRLRLALDILLPDVKAKVQQKQLQQKKNHKIKKRLRSFTPGDHVFVRNYSYGPKWIPAVIASSSGPVSYTVTLGNGQTVKRHVDQVRVGLTGSAPSELDIELEPLSAGNVDLEGHLPSVMDIAQLLPSPEPQDLPPRPETETQLGSEAQVVRR